MSYQLDILATTNGFILPRYLPGVLTSIDFVYFEWPSNLPINRYTVVVESNDTAGPTFRSVSKLQKSVELPHIQYGWDARIGVIPDSMNLPSFESKLSRGCTYILPDTKGRSGPHQMTRIGVDRPSGL